MQLMFDCNTVAPAILRELATFFAVEECQHLRRRDVGAYGVDTVRGRQGGPVHFRQFLGREHQATHLPVCTFLRSWGAGGEKENG